MKNEMDETLKAGCILVDVKTKNIVLIYRKELDDYTFPKGHLEKGETIEECAIRETAEETKRVAKIVKSIEPFDNKYITQKGEKCLCRMYVATDEGKSDNTSTDTHETHLVPYDEVENMLTYKDLKIVWQHFKPQIAKLLVFEKK